MRAKPSTLLGIGIMVNTGKKITVSLNNANDNRNMRTALIAEIVATCGFAMVMLPVAVVAALWASTRRD